MIDGDRMATKINTDYYGAENSWIEVSGTNGYIKTENYSINDHITANNSTKWDIENGAIPDISASPWGIGRSSLSSYGYAVLTCVNRGTSDNYGGNLRKKVYEVNKGNTPVTFVNKSGMIYAPATDYGQNWVLDNKRRFVGKTRPKTNATSDIITTNGIDNGNDLYMGDRQSSGKTVTYADYQQLRYRMGAVGLVKISGNNIDFWSSGIKDLPNLISQFPNEDYMVFGANNWIGLKGSSSASYIRATFGVKTPVPEWLHQLYFDDNVTEWLPFNRAIDNYIGSPSYNSLKDCGTKSAYRVEDLESGTKYADFAQMSLTHGGLPATWICASNYKQVFNDVSYHWELVYFVNVSEWNEVNENQRIPATAGSSYSGRYFMKLVIDDSIYDNYYTACYYALLHEAAFLGLPFSDSYYGEESIGDTHVFLPVFDEHMITTGEYVNGAASLALPNATWGDIFGVDMPYYDPTYDPDAPSLPTINQGFATEITDTSSLPYMRVTTSGYTNPDLIRFQDREFVESTIQRVGIFGVNSYRYIETDDYIDGSTTCEVP